METEPQRRKKNSAAGNAERQRRHRQRHKLHVLELPEEAHSQLQAICRQKGWTIRRAVAEAMSLLQAQMDTETRSALLVEMHSQAVAEQAKFDAAYRRSAPEKPRKRQPPPEPKDVEGQGNLL